MGHPVLVGSLAFQAPLVDEVEATVFEGIVGGQWDADEGQGAVVFGLLASGREDEVGGVGLGHGVEGWIAVVAEAEEGPGVLLVVAVDASTPKDAVGGAEHDAARGFEEDVGQGDAVAGKERFGGPSEVPFAGQRWRVPLVHELVRVAFL